MFNGEKQLVQDAAIRMAFSILKTKGLEIGFPDAIDTIKIQFPSQDSLWIVTQAQTKYLIKKLKEEVEAKDSMVPTSIFASIENELLCKAANGELDLLQLAKNELAQRGLDSNGKWIGFSEAKKLHNYKK